MATPLQILIVEDNPSDAALYLRELRKAGFDPVGPCVETEAAFREALRPELDLILSDYQLPQFSGMAALELLNQSGFSVPFILVSGRIDEDTAVAAMKNGATDYLLKDRLGRLGPAITAALTQRRLRRERNEIHNALKTNEGLFRQVAECIQDVFWIISADGSQLLYISPAYETVWGRTQASLFADPHGWSDAIVEEDRPAALEGMKTLATGGSYEKEFRIRLPDGRIRWIADRGFGVKNTAGDVTVAVGVARDITVRKQESELLAESERRLRDMLSNLDLIAMMLDRQGRATFCNDYFLKLSGWQRGEVIGGDWFTQFMPEKESHRKQCFEEHIVLGTIPAHIECPIITRAGAVREIVWTNTLLHDSAGQIAGMASIGEDVTTRRASERQIQEQLAELLRWQEVILDREDRIIALKTEVNGLLVRLALPAAYPEVNRP